MSNPDNEPQDISGYLDAWAAYQEAPSMSNLRKMRELEQYLPRAEENIAQNSFDIGMNVPGETEYREPYDFYEGGSTTQSQPDYRDFVHPRNTRLVEEAARGAARPITERMSENVDDRTVPGWSRTQDSLLKHFVKPPSHRDMGVPSQGNILMDGNPLLGGSELEGGNFDWGWDMGLKMWGDENL